MLRNVFLCSLAVLLLSPLAPVLSADAPVIIDPAKVDQLSHFVPLTPEVVDIFVSSRQLTKAQADYVKSHIGADGALNLPANAIGPEPAAQAAPPPLLPLQSPPLPKWPCLCQPRQPNLSHRLSLPHLPPRSPLRRQSIPPTLLLGFTITWRRLTETA